MRHVCRVIDVYALVVDAMRGGPGGERGGVERAWKTDIETGLSDTGGELRHKDGPGLMAQCEADVRAEGKRGKRDQSGDDRARRARRRHVRQDTIGCYNTIRDVRIQQEDVFLGAALVAQRVLGNDLVEQRLDGVDETVQHVGQTADSDRRRGDIHAPRLFYDGGSRDGGEHSIVRDIDARLLWADGGEVNDIEVLPPLRGFRWHGVKGK